jgi:phenylacetate-CoA ligase
MQSQCAGSVRCHSCRGITFNEGPQGMSPAGESDHRLLLRLRTAVEQAKHAPRYASLPLIETIEDFRRLPTTCKADLLTKQHDFLTKPIEHYTRIHQTSGTSTGQPLRWYDTGQNWLWMKQCWYQYFALAGITSKDVAFFPFSFGPFLGFWTAFESCLDYGLRTLPGGGLSSTARLKMLLDHQATVLFCTPTYALHLAEVAHAEKLPIHGVVKRIVVAGEPGGAVESTRKLIEEAWGARVLDHYGLTEVGPMAMEPFDQPGGLHIHEDDYFIEVLQPGSIEPVPMGEPGELVVTNLGRCDSPVLRYRTGDLVRQNPFAVDDWYRLEGGILGRLDDMLHIRGNNVYPTAIEAVLRSFPEVQEFRLLVDDTQALHDLMIEIETATPSVVQPVSQALRDKLLFRCDVRAVAPGTLPRFEMKAKRLVKKSKASGDA